MSPPNPRVLFIQDGARRRYAVPLALQRAGLLARMECDWYSTPGSAQAMLASLMQRLRPPLGQRMRARYHPELAPSRIASHPSITLRRMLHRNHFRAAQQMTRCVLRRGFADANTLMGFVRNLDPQLALRAQQAGLKTIADQIIAPAAVEIAELRRQHERFPGYEPAPNLDALSPYIEWEQQTWAALDRITCMSAYVREALLSQGVAASRISVLEYPLETREFPAIDRRGRQALTVGFLGSVSLRKGAPYFLQVARRLACSRVKFVMAGPIALSPRVVDDHRDVVQFTGPLPRTQVPTLLAGFDVFLFPTTCEGSAGAVMEALAAGLPVITSPNAGSIIRDGADGFIVAYDDIEAMSQRLAALLDDESLRQRIGAAARASVGEFTIDRYQRQLVTLLQDVVADTLGAAA